MLGQEGHTLSDSTRAPVIDYRVVKRTAASGVARQAALWCAQGLPSAPSFEAQLCRQPQHPHLPLLLGLG